MLFSGKGICASGTQTCSNNAWSSCVAQTPKIEVCGNDVDEDCNGVAENCSSGVYRSFSVNPTTKIVSVTVTLTKILSSNQGTVLVEETVPSGLTIVDSGSGSATGNIIKWFELNVAKSGTYNYTVKTPSVTGGYIFPGAYTINGGSGLSIGGSSTLTVNN